MSTSYSFTDTQKALIKPFDRIKFIIAFIFLTIASQLVAHYFVAAQPAFQLLRERSYIQYSVASGAIFGTFSGAAQWLVLRRYIRDWRWILVAALSTIVLLSVQGVFDAWKESLFASRGLNQIPILLLAIVSLSMTIGQSFLSGYLQWFVISPYVKSALWWIRIPFIAALTVGLLSALVVLTNTWFNLDVLRNEDSIRLIILEVLTVSRKSLGSISVLDLISFSFLRMSVLPIIQAISFCLLNKKSINDQATLQSPLALAPDIVDYWDIKRLEKILYLNINRLWKADLSMADGQLTYLVGVSHSGAILAYESMDQASTDNVSQTPLPELAIAPQDETMEAQPSMAFAKFQVVFMPPGILQINAWRGIPLLWIGVALGIGIVGISGLFAWLQIDILSFRK
jgi:hypothetical protein